MDLIKKEDPNNFTISLDEHLYFFNSYKKNIVRYIKKNFYENIDYIKQQTNSNKGKFSTIKYLFKYNSFELLKKSYNHRTITLGKNSITHPILTNIENATITFICETFENFNYKRQYKVDKYYIDLYFIDKNLAIECDESHHDNNKQNDIYRQSCIEKKIGCEFYRYKPDENNFKLSKIIHDIMLILYK